MTTLPQTLGPDGDPSHAGHADGHANGRLAPSANGRIPPVSTLPAISAPLSAAVSPAAAGGAGGGAGPQLSGGDVFRILRENMWLLILAAIIGGAGGYALYQYLRENHIAYEATGILSLREPREFDPIQELRNNGGGLFETGDDLDVRLQTQAASIENDQLFTDVLLDADSPLRKSRWLRGVAGRGTAVQAADAPEAVGDAGPGEAAPPDAAGSVAAADMAVSTGGAIAVGGGVRIDVDEAKEALYEAFDASPIRGTRLIRVSFEADDPTEARDILTYVVNKHLDDQRERARLRTGDMVRDMEEVIGDRKQEIEVVDRAMRSLEGTRGTQAEAAGSIAGLEMALRQLSGQQFQINQNLELVSSQLADAEEAVRRGAMPAGVEQIVSANPEIATMRAQIRNTEMGLAMNEETLGENHSSTRGMRRSLDVLTRSLRDREDELRVTEREGLLARLRNYKEQLEATQARVEAEHNAVDEEYVKVSKANADLRQLEVQKQAKEERLALAEQALQLRQQQARTRADDLKPLDWADRPARPTSPSFPQLPLIVGGSILGMLGLALGIAFLREILDTSVKSPRDVIRAGQMDVLGVIPDEDDDPEAVAGDGPLELCIAKAPHSMTAEQFRTVRGRLAQVVPLETTRTILVTSPQPGDGKTTVACNLAAGMALNGRRTLLVDANFRRPAIHEVFEIANDRGLATALADVDAFDDSVVDVEGIPNLSVLPSGPRPANATELIEGPSFTEVLDRAWEQFDLVIFDSGPVLFVSETGALAPQVDGVISVVRARKSSRGLLGRLRDSLRSLNVEHLGVVLNAVRSRAGGYYKRNIKNYYAYQDARK